MSKALKFKLVGLLPLALLAAPTVAAVALLWSPVSALGLGLMAAALAALMLAKD